MLLLLLFLRHFSNQLNCQENKLERQNISLINTKISTFSIGFQDPFTMKISSLEKSNQFFEKLEHSITNTRVNASAYTAGAILFNADEQIKVGEEK